MSRIIQTYLHDGRLTRHIETLSEAELAKRAERLKREGHMPSKAEVEEVLRSVLGVTARDFPALSQWFFSN